MSKVIDIPIHPRTGGTTAVLALLNGYRSQGVNAVLIVTESQRHDLVRSQSLMPDDWLLNVGLFHNAGPRGKDNIYLVDDSEKVESLWANVYPGEGSLRSHLDAWVSGTPMRKAFMITLRKD